MTSMSVFRVEKRSAHSLSQAQGGLLFVDCVCLCRSVRVLRLNEIHEVRTFSPCKDFLFVYLFSRHLKIALDSEKTMLMP